MLLDGGVRRGTDVIKAMCLGTTACLIARPFLYALAAGGEHGVSDLLRIPRAEIQTSLSLMGCASLAERDESWLEPVASLSNLLPSRAPQIRS